MIDLLMIVGWAVFTLGSITQPDKKIKSNNYQHLFVGRLINILVSFLLRHLNWIKRHSIMKIGRIFFVWVYIDFLAPDKDIENLILPMLSCPGCHMRAPYICCIGTHAYGRSDVIVMLKLRHHVMSHLSVFRNFWEPSLTMKMWYLMVSKKKYPLVMWGWDRKICPRGSLFEITRKASWCQTMILGTDFHISHSYCILIIFDFIC